MSTAVLKTSYTRVPECFLSREWIFNKLETGGDGLVSVEELPWLLDWLGLPSPTIRADLLVGERSLDNVDFLFFYESLMKGGALEKEKCEEDEILERNLRNAFWVFDLNGDGFISCEGCGMARGQDCKRLINGYNDNSDGLLNFEELKDTMLES